MEQRIVSALGVCRHQLHQELGLRCFCSYRFLDRRIHIDDTFAQAERSAWTGGEVMPRFPDPEHKAFCAHLGLSEHRAYDVAR